MEDSQAYSFVVKSQIHDYSVEFINDLQTTLKNELIEGDFIIIDNKIINLYNNLISKTLLKHKYIGIDSSEPQKSYQEITPIIENLIEQGFRKNHRLVAVGGGITQDVTAFIASIMYRGVDWIFFPTSLLSQGDSCIGSKTSINFGRFKNQLGGFYPPNKIFIFPEFLKTLSHAEIKSGMGEMLHYFIVSGKSDFDFYKNNYKKAFTDKNILAKIILRSLKIKKRYIEQDEYDENIRQVFNYGHSFGHAIESLTNYKIPHGVAVSFGMDIANFISLKMGILDKEVRDEIREVTEYIWEGYSIKIIEIESFKHALSKDKKNVGTKLGLILNKGFGEVFKNIMEPDHNFTLWLKEYFDNEI